MKGIIPITVAVSLLILACEKKPNNPPNDNDNNPPDTTSGFENYQFGTIEHIFTLTDSISTGKDIKVYNSIAYVADYKQMKIIDFSEPTAPVFLGQYPPEGNLWGYSMALDYRENRVYLVDSTPRFYIFDVSDPTSPEVLSRLSLTGTILDVAVSGDYAYIAAYTDGIAVVDISNETNPNLLSNIECISSAIFIEGDRLFSVSGIEGRGGNCFDISNPSSPTAIFGFRTNGYALDVAARLGYIFVADGVFRATNTGAFSIRDTAGAGIFVDSLANSCQGVAVNHNFVYLVDWNNGPNSNLYVYNVHNPQEPSLEYSGENSPSVRVTFDPMNEKYIYTSGRGGIAVFYHNFQEE